MKRFCFLLICLLLLSGCGDIQNDRRILVSIRETAGCTVENNGQYLLPGEDAVFTVTLDRGLSLTGTDYPGTVQIDTRGNTATVTVTGISYPTRISLEVSHDYAQITYHANGGYALHSLETQITTSYSLQNRSRPNTDTGSDTFAREGHTLVCWNTEADGSGTRIGLGSRITVTGGQAELYAQWARWSDASRFSWSETESGVTITGYTGSDDPLVIPETLDEKTVTAIAPGAFRDCPAETVILPKSLETLSPGAFQSCGLKTLVLFDNIASMADDSFRDCHELQTLYINAIEAPFGYLYRKESCYADKVDLLLAAQGEHKLVFYGGCSMWYNLDGYQAQQAVGEEYRVINMGLNGTVNSAVQMQILEAFLEPGDVLFHTPELSSRHQLLTQVDMLDTDKTLWCGIENNYDLFSLVDMTTVGGVLDSLQAYLDRKDSRTTYASRYTDEQEQEYLDKFGGIPFSRIVTAQSLGDNVYLDAGRIDAASMAALENYYRRYQDKGVTVYVSYACLNLDAVAPEQQNNGPAMEQAFRDAIAAMEGPVLLGAMEDFAYRQEDFFDTNYHLLSDPAQENTARWLGLLIPQMVQDGLLKGADQ